ncbi:MAG: leucine-rich repeat protein [Alistipes sp.]|nr:leucine-rich repeat protein [Alistipes sp.]
MALKFKYNKETITAVVCGVEDKFCEQIVIPSTVEYYGKKYDVVAIKKQAFRGCIKLKSVTIPNGVTEIGVCAFFLCI